MSAKYNYLKSSLKYDRFDYWHLLKAFLPRGPIWRIRQPNEQDIKPESIPSEEAFGVPTITQS